MCLRGEYIAVLRILFEFFCFGEVSSILIFTQTTMEALYLFLLSGCWKRARSWLWDGQDEEQLLCSTLKLDLIHFS